MHNMMVEAWVNNGSVECATVYNTLVAAELERGVDGNDSDGVAMTVWTLR